MKFKYGRDTIVLLFLLLIGFNLPAQPNFPGNYPIFIDSLVANVNIYIDPDSLAQIFHPDSAESYHEYPATFVFDNGVLSDTIENVGFRLRGNTSRFSQKKSFKVSFNSFIRGRKYYGFEKLNLNGEHNDPSIIRSKLSWDIFKKMRVPAPRSSHVMLYINNVYYGLYINVEHIDENFVKSRFGNNDGNLYKCLWPADLNYLGADPNLYKLTQGNRRVYELKTNKLLDDYSDLANFISVLNLTGDSLFASEIQKIFDVNTFLKNLAVDVLVGGWDDYWFLKNNYYLYLNTETEKFEYIPYDFDNTFGIWWDGILPGVDWGSRDIYTWGNPNENRPLADRILDVQEFRDRFSYYMNQAVQNIFNSNSLNSRIDSIHNMITPAAVIDTFRTKDYGYTIADFHNSYTQALGGHVTYGLKPYITTRSSSAFSQLIINNIPPIISDVSHLPAFPQITDTIYFNVKVEDETQNLIVELYYKSGDVWQNPLLMFDDGLHNDGEVGDGIFGIYLLPLNLQSNIGYYILAEDSAGLQSTAPFNAPQNIFTFTVGYQNPKLFVNEFMASNDTTIADEFGEYDDWIEIYNGDTAEVWLGDKYLTDNLSNPDKWQLPDTILAVDGFLLIWADGQDNQGPLHTSYKLSKGGEQVGIFNNDSTGFALIDSITYGSQATDISFGRYPDGGFNWQTFNPATPGNSNIILRIQNRNDLITRNLEVYQNYPNPFNPVTNIKFRIYFPGKVKINIFNNLGQLIKTLSDEFKAAGKYSVLWDGTNQNNILVSSGFYIYTIKINNQVISKRMILLK